MNTSKQHAIIVRRWRDDVKVALVKFEEVRKQRTIDGDTIPTYDHAMLILAAAKRLRLASGQLTAAIDDWIDAHEPQLRVHTDLPEEYSSRRPQHEPALRAKNDFPSDSA